MTLRPPANSLKTPGANLVDQLQCNLGALVLLGGSIRADSFISFTQRLCLDLPLGADRRLWDLWIAEATALRALPGCGNLPVRILKNREAADPLPPATLPDGFTIEQDPFQFRGTGGVLRDLAEQYTSDTYLLVANAAQVFIEPLLPLVRKMAQAGGDVVLLSHDDAAPSGLMLIRAGSLLDLPPIGFLDLKEQALPLIARGNRISILHCPSATALPLRTADNYLSALRRLHRADAAPEQDPFAERCRPTFAIVEKGASVDPTARLHDSVILAGARVEAGARVVGSVVCPGGRVGRNRLVVEALVKGHRQPRPRS